MSKTPVNPRPNQDTPVVITSYDPNDLKNIYKNKPALILLIICIIALSTAGYLAMRLIREGISFKQSQLVVTPPPGLTKTELKKFTSEQEFKEYLLNSQSGLNGSFLGISPKSLAAPMPGVSEGMAPSAAQGTGAETPAIDRVSETNVQVKGIDEPDIVKVDGVNIYYSSSAYRAMPMMMSQPVRPGIMPPQPFPAGSTQIFAAFPPESLVKKGTIDKQGDLLLGNKLLMVFSGNEISGVDVSDPTNPKETWKVNFEGNTYLTTSRLYQGKVYLVTRNTVNSGTPCPLQPLSLGSNKMSIPCTEIYHPAVSTPVDSTYTVLKLNPADGKVESQVSFVGSGGSSVIYMSEKAIYITYYYQGDYSRIIYGLFKESGKDLIPQDTFKKIEVLQSYDISNEAKLVEINSILDRYKATLGSDDRMKFENELNNRSKEYISQHLRELEKTGIVKVDLGSLNVAANSLIPGAPLNQFALDEYQGNLRVATTVGQTFGSGQTVNDVYVLDKDLNILGSVLDLGKGERIYSTRFLDNRGYLVTFKKTDPFFVLDLSNPRSPQVKGQLKIPGFSSYLDPLSKDRILGVGQGGAQVKLSLFDVSNPDNPTEVDKYQLDEYWTEVQGNHKAFLKDEKYKIFFLPGGKGGYIFSYNGDKLAMEKAVSGFAIKRAVFINDYLYVLGESQIVVFNEKDWSEVKRLTL